MKKILLIILPLILTGCSYNYRWALSGRVAENNRDYIKIGDMSMELVEEILEEPYNEDMMKKDKEEIEKNKFIIGLFFRRKF